MVNVAEKRKCIGVVDGVVCGAQRPAFNYQWEYEVGGQYCGKCKDDDMVNYAHLYCTHDYGSCFKHATHNYKGETIGMVCAQHALANMRNVVSPTCDTEGCPSLSRSFNQEGETGAYCAECGNKLGMVNVAEKRICKYEDCDKHTKDFYCSTHFYVMNPTIAKPPYHKHQEHHFKLFIIENYNNHKLEETINGKNGKKYRVDCVLRSDKIIVLECDEDQHKDTTNYTPIDDKTRTDSIFEYFKKENDSVYIIRFNPDKYKLNDTEIPSGWINRTENTEMRPNEPEWSNRLSKLKETIDNLTDKYYIELFFDT
jgi:hypothetical protein